MKWLGRILALAGCASFLWSLTSRAWWSGSGGSELFEDMTVRLGPYVGEWCSGVFCHDEKLARFGDGFALAGTIAFYAGLVAAAAVIMMVLARRERIRMTGGAAVLALAVMTVAGLALVALRDGRRMDVWQTGAGLPVFCVGAALAIAGCVITMRNGVEVMPPLKRPVAMGLVVVGALVAGITIQTKTFWNWKWSDEVNRVGLTSTERCWVRPSGSLCSKAASVAEMFMLDRRDAPRFVAHARQTRDSTIAAIVLALLALAVRRMRDVAHAPWIVVGLLAFVTARLTPDVGAAREIHLGPGFALLALGCLIAIAGSARVKDA